MNAMIIARVFRFAGVLLGVFFLLPAEHQARHYTVGTVQVLGMGVGVFSCLPYSRMRNPAIFWFAASVYTGLAVAFAIVFGLNFWGFWTPQLRDLDSIGFAAFLTGIFVVLFVQTPCILFLRMRQSPNQHLLPTPR
jgi:hypothetical protein